MASIDKIYCDTYSEYKEFKDWTDTQTLTFFNGYKISIGNYIWERKESEFNGSGTSIASTPVWLDIYLIQNCKSQFVLDRMKEVHDEEDFIKFQTLDLTAKPPIECQQNRKITIKKDKHNNFPYHKKPYGKRSEWTIRCNDDFWYHDETKTWSDSDYFHYPSNTNLAFIARSFKAVVRHLRKQYLPKNISFDVWGNYKGEDYVFFVS